MIELPAAKGVNRGCDLRLGGMSCFQSSFVGGNLLVYMCGSIAN